MTHFFSFVFPPLFVRGRWFFWLLLVLVLLLLGDSISAIRMELPTREQVVKVNGQWDSVGKELNFRPTSRGARIIDSAGNVHRCGCLGYHCVGSHIFENNDLLAKLDGKQGELWLYSTHFIYSGGNACYQISSGGQLFRQFDQSVSEYSAAKHSFGAYLVWFLVSLPFLTVLGRSSIFFMRNRNG